MTIDPGLKLQTNEACRAAGCKFYAASSLGLGGFIFCDLIQHIFTMYVSVPLFWAIELRAG